MSQPVKGGVLVSGLPDAQKALWWKLVLQLPGHPAAAFVLAFIVYLLFAAIHQPVFSTSAPDYFNYLADAFLHGQFHLRLMPSTLHDLVVVGEKVYLYWPPFPAILMMPFVAMFGVGFSDIFFTVVMGALNVSLFALLLIKANEHDILHLDATQRSLFVVFFAFGTVHFNLAPFGRVWFTSQIISVFCLLLTYLAAVSLKGPKAFFLTGLALAATAFTRNSMVFAGLWPGIYLLWKHHPQSKRQLVQRVLLGILPLALMVAFTAYYNYARFGNPLDVGLSLHRMDPSFRAGFEEHGMFSLYYVPTNLYYQYIAYPLPISDDTYMGGSLFLLSPVFFAAFWGIAKGRPRWSVWTLVVTIMLVNIPILMLMGTGWVTFGPRYTLDFTVPLLLLTGMGVKHWPKWLLAVLTCLSVIQYIIGTLVLGLAV